MKIARSDPAGSDLAIFSRMLFIFYIFVGLLGLVIGSFLNCVIYRLEKEESLRGRSYCPHCNHTLSWKDLFPVLSFVFLRGKCRYCHKKISIQYPVVEISTGLIFLLIFNFQFPVFSFINLIFLFYIASALMVIFVYDIKHYVIPDAVLLFAIAITFACQLIFETHFLLFNSLWAALGAFLFFWVIYFFSKEKWMGFGDCKLAVLLGLLLGFPKIIAGLFLAFLFGAIIGISLMILSLPAGKGKISLKSQLPFAPFLIVGTYVAMFFGNHIIQWYLHFIF